MDFFVYNVGAITMVAAYIFSIVLWFLRYNSSGRIAILDLTVKLRVLALIMILIGMMTRTPKPQLPNDMMAYAIVWTAITLITLFCKLFNAQRFPVVANIIFSILMWMMYFCLR